MSTENSIFIILLLWIIFLPIILFIIESQKEYKHENDEVIRVKIGFLSYISVFNMILFAILCLTFLFIAYQLLFVTDFILTNIIIGMIFLILFFFFTIPVVNTYNHLLKESKREIYFFRNKKALLVVEKETEITIDLEDEMIEINHEVSNKSSKYQTGHGKYNFIQNDEIIPISDLIKFPQDFLDQNNIEQVKVSKLFIWI
ncbi:MULTISPECIES: hypothetical protein [Empedobacter]|uniref:Uncharacterized protein n=2 Tax=Empedobacter TaxID=59734 RepID=A0A3R8TQC5_9FLAO|nr:MULTISPECIES: hypothetical protein [Empedobacter]MBW1617466.1 hypothetical protein [Empedobacter falsenii]MCA4775499.1 hypothetical protein [Empedobacter stercoris]MCA4808394.1 hypothetical protein [Empedobacter stercoris]MDH2207184.1 hypothetical protein [Empedobacter sp. GD03644]QLL59465.1 hypothetical protein FH779_15835 [Empedobacter falsenii]